MKFIKIVRKKNSLAPFYSCYLFCWAIYNNLFGFMCKVHRLALYNFAKLFVCEYIAVFFIYLDKIMSEHYLFMPDYGP
jgi:hypothetical protein